ncbi:MAG: PIN domain-containing protein [Candidatus Bathyarchaeia archaeon]
MLFSRIFVVNDIVIENKMEEIRKILDTIDPADTPFIALALSVENDGIWSDDKHFKRQSKIKI